MAQPSAEIKNIARLAIEEAYIDLVAMLMAEETGEVAVVVGFNSLEPQSRPIKKRRRIKVERGHWATVEVVR